MKQIYRFTEKDEVLQSSIAKLNSYFEESVQLPVLFLTSGGSALQLVERIKKVFLKPSLTISVLDERYSEDKNVNNFALLTKTVFYNDAAKAGCSFIDTRVHHNENGETHADRFQKQLKQWRTENSEGIIIATMGMGPDGHISGIMPFPENETLFNDYFENEAVWVKHYNAGNKNEYPLRTTTTIPFIEREIDKAVMVVTGDEKRKAFDSILEEEKSVAEVPGRVIHKMKDISIFCDVE